MARYFGDDSSNQYTGTAYRDMIYGNGGDDWLYGRGGNDLIVGGSGNDVLFGEEGTDRFRGGNGDDVIYTGPGVAGQWEVARGGAGNDRVFADGGYIDADGSVHGVGNLRAFGGAGNDELRAGMADAWLSGGAGNDYLEASAGYLSGDAGNDVLYGQGNVTLRGGGGNDELHAFLAGTVTAVTPFGLWQPATATMEGGAGADTFFTRAVWDAYSSTATIQDFRPDEGDRLDLSAYVQGDMAGGSQFYFNWQIFSALDTGADGLTADGKIDLQDTASGAATLSPEGWLTLHFFGDSVVLANGPAAVDLWMTA